MTRWMESLVPLLAPLLLLTWLAEVGRIQSPPPELTRFECLEIGIREVSICSDPLVWELPRLPPFDEEAFERQYLLERIGGLRPPW